MERLVMKSQQLFSVIAALGFFAAISPGQSTACANETCGFVYSDGTYTPLSVPGSTLTEAFGLNNGGQIVGQYWTGDSASTAKAFLYSGGAYTTISGPGGASIQPNDIVGGGIYGINDRGQIV
jgi:probable HAF family extracellular repeat protein